MGDMFRRIEKRKAVRVGTVLKVTYRVAGRFFTNFAEDINTGGMFIATSKPLPPGTIITLELFPLGSPQSLRVRAMVAWVRNRLSTPGSKRGMGIQFEGLSETEAARIKEIVDELKGAK
jgi:uncharacterized protein (TIGR02266 family)